MSPLSIAATEVTGTLGNGDWRAGSLTALCGQSQTSSSCVLSFLQPTSRLLVWILLFGFALHFSHLSWCLFPCPSLSLGSRGVSGSSLSS